MTEITSLKLAFLKLKVELFERSDSRASSQRSIKMTDISSHTQSNAKTKTDTLQKQLGKLNDEIEAQKGMYESCFEGNRILRRKKKRLTGMRKQYSCSKIQETNLWF